MAAACRLGANVPARSVRHEGTRRREIARFGLGEVCCSRRGGRRSGWDHWEGTWTRGPRQRGRSQRAVCMSRDKPMQLTLLPEGGSAAASMLAWAAMDRRHKQRICIVEGWISHLTRRGAAKAHRSTALPDRKFVQMVRATAAIGRWRWLKVEV